MTIKLMTRREFIEDLKGLAKLGLLGIVGLSFLESCSGSVPDTDDLDPPYICDNTCNTGLGGNYNVTNGTAPTYLVFGAYNPESGFSGYNIWYGNPATLLQSQHLVANRTNVIDSTGSLTVDRTSLGSSIPTIPSSLASGTLNQTTYVPVQVDNTTSGDSIYVTAYSSIDNLDSVLSNVYTVP